MKRITPLLVLLTVVGCSTHPEVLPQEEVPLPGMTIVGAELIKPTHDIDEVTVYVTWYETKAELNRIYQRLCIDNVRPCEKSVLGFTHVDPEEKVCDIHALKPITVDEERMKVLGHEFSHCLFGDFHE